MYTSLLQVVAQKFRRTYNDLEAKGWGLGRLTAAGELLENGGEAERYVDVDVLQVGLWVMVEVGGGAQGPQGYERALGLGKGGTSVAWGYVEMYDGAGQVGLARPLPGRCLVKLPCLLPAPAQAVQCINRDQSRAFKVGLGPDTRRRAT